ncbi:MAG: ArgE/DapE family deacylase [Acidimicrobiia bacterium]|nr:ArgE/DapE family deacylase [Acidimicrobiia bacterium]
MDRITDRLAELISIPSVTGDEVAIRDQLAEMLEHIGLTVDVFDADLDSLSIDPEFPGMEVERTVLPVVCGTLNPDAPGTHPMLSGHIDVVPAGDPASWTSDPFTPRIDGGRMYGRGACDMKGGVVAILETLDALIELGHRGPVSVAFVPSEEDGGSGTLAAIRRGTDADLVVIPEPTDLEIVTAHAGAITFRLVIPGRAAHAAIRTEGVSALDGLQTIRAALAEDERHRNTAVPDPRMAELGLPYPTIVGTITGGVWASSVIDAVEVTGRYGVKLDQGVTDAAGDLERCLRAAWEADPFLSGFGMDFEVFGASFDSCEIADDHELAVGLARSVTTVTGRRAQPKGLPAGTDMRLFVNQAGIPAVLFGPGDLRVAHAADEHVDLRDVATCAAVLTDWVKTLDAY